MSSDFDALQLGEILFIQISCTFSASASWTPFCFSGGGRDREAIGSTLAGQNYNAWNASGLKTNRVACGGGTQWVSRLSCFTEGILPDFDQKSRNHWSENNQPFRAPVTSLDLIEPLAPSRSTWLRSVSLGPHFTATCFGPTVLRVDLFFQLFSVLAP